MTVYLFIAAGVVALFYLGIRFGRAYIRLRGTRVITCPADQTRAAVDVSAGKAAATAMLGSPSFTLTSCSHWPERRGCGQQCLSQIDAAPIDCLVRTQLTAWYKDKTCALCRRPVGTIDWYERAPALLAPDGRTLPWSAVEAARLDDILRTHVPVCFDCHVAETFRRTHPELVLDNPFGAAPPGRA
jgi:hypothetical protein